MKQKYGRHFGTSTPQFQRIPESEQIRNRAGGWAFPVTDEVQLERFLILGTAENTYYATSRELTREIAACIDRLLEEGKGELVVTAIEAISTSGRAPKNEPAVFALAMCIKLGDVGTRRKAAEVMPNVCRTATHMYQFAEAVKLFSKVRQTERGQIVPMPGWGRVVKRAFRNWLANKDNERLAYQMVKYRQREGWTVRDVLRKAKPKPSDVDRDLLYSWAVNRDKAEGPWGGVPGIIEGFEAAQSAERAEEIVNLVKTYNLPWEAIPSQWARDLEVQEALFETMPITATIRQLGRLTNIGLIAPGSDATRRAVERLTNREILRRGRVHPMNLYLAHEVYNVGQGLRGKLSWAPVREVSEALGVGFFAAFGGGIQPSGKNIVIGVDSSQSMNHGGVMSIPQFRCVEAAFVSAYVQAGIEPNARMMLFDTDAYPVSQIRHVETLGELVHYARQLFRSGGGTNCAAPIMYAQEHWNDVDAFCIYTDNESWYGSPHPIEALWQYRQKWGRPAKLVSQAFVANDYSIDPMEDAASLAVVGMDEAAPSIISDFVRVD
jgi:60 kDa SS-A/Ro ribonucleoprotein